jgi:hypothetical protein
MRNNNWSLSVDKIELSAMPGDAATGLDISLTFTDMGGSAVKSYRCSFDIGTKVPNGPGLAANVSAKKGNYRIFKLDAVPEVLHRELLSFDPETGKGVVRLTCRINSKTPSSRIYTPTEKKAMREFVLGDLPKDISMQASINVMANVAEEDTELVITLPVALFQ